jgi:signal transduction histidine kinase
VLAARDKMAQGLESIRQIVRLLDPENESTAFSDLVSSMRLCAEQFATNTPISLVHNLREISVDMAIQKRHAEFITGALMELLSNASRAHGVSKITVLLSFSRDYIRLVVCDDGDSFVRLSEEQKNAKLSKGFGLKKIKKYVRECGGEFQIKAIDNFEVDFSIPIRAEGENGE